MELDRSYDLNDSELEASVRDTYSKGIKKLRESEDALENLNTLEELFVVLGDSHPIPRMGVESGDLRKRVAWAKDLIKAYRNLGRIFSKYKETGIDLKARLEMADEYEKSQSELDSL